MPRPDVCIRDCGDGVDANGFPLPQCALGQPEWGMACRTNQCCVAFIGRLTSVDLSTNLFIDGQQKELNTVPKLQRHFNEIMKRCDTETPAVNCPPMRQIMQCRDTLNKSTGSYPPLQKSKPTSVPSRRPYQSSFSSPTSEITRRPSSMPTPMPTPKPTPVQAFPALSWSPTPMPTPAPTAPTSSMQPKQAQASASSPATPTEFKARPLRCAGRWGPLLSADVCIRDCGDGVDAMGNPLRDCAENEDEWGVACRSNPCCSYIIGQLTEVDFSRNSLVGSLHPTKNTTEAVMTMYRHIATVCDGGGTFVSCPSIAASSQCRANTEVQPMAAPLAAGSKDAPADVKAMIPELSQKRHRATSTQELEAGTAAYTRLSLGTCASEGLLPIVNLAACERAVKSLYSNSVPVRSFCSEKSVQPWCKKRPFGCLSVFNQTYFEFNAKQTSLPCGVRQAGQKYDCICVAETESDSPQQNETMSPQDEKLRARRLAKIDAGSPCLSRWGPLPRHDICIRDCGDGLDEDGKRLPACDANQKEWGVACKKNPCCSAFLRNLTDEEYGRNMFLGSSLEHVNTVDALNKSFRMIAQTCYTEVTEFNCPSKRDMMQCRDAGAVLAEENSSFTMDDKQLASSRNGARRRRTPTFDEQSATAVERSSREKGGRLQRKVKTDASSFQRVTRGTCSSRGFQDILDMATCERAASEAALGALKVSSLCSASGSATWCVGRPRGCIYDGGSRTLLQLNRASALPCGWRHAGRAYNCLCQRKLPPESQRASSSIRSNVSGHHGSVGSGGFPETSLSEFHVQASTKMVMVARFVVLLSTGPTISRPTAAAYFALRDAGTAVFKMLAARAFAAAGMNITMTVKRAVPVIEWLKVRESSVRTRRLQRPKARSLADLQRRRASSKRLRRR
eukprot:TRINITY_DN49110_c0_g1_i1.p1 TRINITY_DN49110_c0_g1~~TRINITY_DN49110_c0_g1_i1.p1  ORF type:complete len:961 (-),score=143.58 TRINITY_DN49110_c0_g1_i1:104-2818(-)